MNGHGTGYAETEALLDVLDGDTDAARRTIAGMAFGERDRLVEALHELSDLITAMS